ncbi:MAG: TetR/AcrR family transcriptional regulator [Deltaproteobacteria bacterium]|nr:TetR/AcrR family transcriptional regulator [Deltaproteobacteria bacterium]
MKIQKRKDWEKLQRQNRIIDIAENLFSSRGYDDTTMDRVAAEAGYCKRTLYIYFKDKDDLFASIVLRGLRTLNTMLHEAYESNELGLEKIRAIARTYFRFFCEDPVSFNFMIAFDYKNRYYHRPMDPEKDGIFKVECQKIGDDNADLTIRAIEAAIEDGTIKTKLSPLQLLLILWGQLSGVMEMIATREQFLGEIYNTNAEKLFNNFMELTEKSLIEAK